jgi:hypothetical protein
MSLINIDQGHYQVHAGYSFSVCKTSLAVANAANQDIRFKTGSKSCHMAFDISLTGKANVLIYEASTISAGTALTVINNNRNIANTALATVTHTPTVTAVGTTILADKLIGTASSGVVMGGAGSGRNELIFKPNTEYLIRVTNTSGAAIDIGNCINFYEA